MSCTFNDIPCSFDEFQWRFDPLFGNCYIYNTGLNGSLKQSTVAGPYYGLRMQLYIGYHENLTLFNSFGNSFFNRNNFFGGFIFVDNASSYTDHTIDGGTLVSAGFETVIALERSFSFILPKPYSKCELDNNAAPDSSPNSLVPVFVNSGFGYSQQLCIKQCYQKEMIKICNCTDPYILSFLNYRVCNSLSEINCVNTVWASVYINQTYIPEHCLPLCPLECNKTVYTTRVSSLVLTGGEYYTGLAETNPNISADFVSRPVNEARAIQSFLAVYVFYDSLSYTQSIEAPQMDLVALLASMGGNLGLFLGVSVFSLGELVQVAIEIFFIKTNKKVLSAEGIN